MTNVYPIFYGTRYVDLDTLRATFGPHMHPEYARRLFAWIESKGGHLGIGGGYRPPGTQPNRPGFATPGQSFHEGQPFPSGTFYAAVDLVAANPGATHRAVAWSQVLRQGSPDAAAWGVHANVDTEAWHMQPIELDGWAPWVNRGRPDLVPGRPLPVAVPIPPPVTPPVIYPNPTNTEGITVEFTSRNLTEGTSGPDVKFFQRQLNELAGAGLLLDGQYGPKTRAAVENWQRFFGLGVDGQAGPKTQRSIIEIALLNS